jgi:hypothetical protein
MVLVETFTGAAYWASYLVNGDASGLEPNEKALADAWLARIAPYRPACTVDDEDGNPAESRFTWHYAMHTGADCQGGDVLDYVCLAAPVSA